MPKLKKNTKCKPKVGKVTKPKVATRFAMAADKVGKAKGKVENVSLRKKAAKRKPKYATEVKFGKLTVKKPKAKKKSRAGSQFTQKELEIMSSSKKRSKKTSTVPGNKRPKKKY